MPARFMLQPGNCNPTAPRAPLTPGLRLRCRCGRFRYINISRSGQIWASISAFGDMRPSGPYGDGRTCGLAYRSRNAGPHSRIPPQMPYMYMHTFAPASNVQEKELQKEKEKSKRKMRSAIFRHTQKWPVWPVCPAHPVRPAYPVCPACPVCPVCPVKLPNLPPQPTCSRAYM